MAVSGSFILWLYFARLILIKDRYAVNMSQKKALLILFSYVFTLLLKNTLAPGHILKYTRPIAAAGRVVLFTW